MFEQIYETEPMTKVYCDWLIERAKTDDKIVVLENDLAHASGTYPFKEAFPERFFNNGVAEANSICIAAGMAAHGFVPFVNSLVSFITRRCYDQIVISVAYSGLNVKVIGLRPGITCEANGGTHCGVEDMGIMRNIPGFTVVDACDNTSLKKLLPQVADLPAPVYLRFDGKKIRKVYNDNDEIVLGKANVIKEGKDLTVIANDMMVGYAMDAANILEKEGIDIGIIDMHTVKPIDAEAVLKAAANGPILAADNHSIYNGLGSAVAEVLAENACGVPFARFGFQDCFGVVGSTAEEVAEMIGVTPEDMVKAIKKLLK